ncbi:hypothetical protein EV193_102613 [Herbihabitans rhizosphaerae]|uniref:Uncharacterized protein n=1 Tax=Herbihabitans rhizosphaerae TaxID=1872711 RepID=A0A4Q7L5T4_9PSEU|nr:hypothetical protein [Herbihabitans rhizosphaerae]RZS43632.1 hypothetical protein EV193_102613 [Herbihabitans rhizosphaerae]
MRRTAVKIRYLWWQSCYDGLLHAFPMVVGAPLSHRHYRAKCTHAAPPDVTDPAPGTPRCELCVMMTSQAPT